MATVFVRRVAGILFKEEYWKFYGVNAGKFASKSVRGTSVANSADRTANRILMLRISAISESETTTTLRLEGHLAGPWIAEFRDACERALVTGRKVTIDLAGVSLIERSGLDLLAALSRRSVVLMHCSPFQEEQLRRAFETSSETPTAHDPA